MILSTIKILLLLSLLLLLLLLLLLTIINYNFWNELNISKEEFLALKGLSGNKDIILQKADKGNSVVLVKKADYTKRMKELLSDASTFKEIAVEPGKQINLLLQHEGKLIEFLK